ncbi:MAG: hypothetical protein EBZ75_12860 [Oxalobacteraceae bacterium]|nr:hypothetical protein [Oxalobacteraceae bacterium]
MAPVLTVGELTACQPVSVSWRGASPDTGLYSLQWVRVSGSGAYDFTNSYTMITVRGTSTSLGNWFGSGATYAIRVFAMRADWDGVWHSTQNVTPHSQVVTFTVPGCAPAAEATATSTTVASGSSSAPFEVVTNDEVRALAVQSDGKILLGGLFTTVGSPAVTTNHFARLNSDGTLDTGFSPNVTGLNVNPDVYAIALQSDGKIVIGGNFTSVGGTTRNRVARLNSDGSLDASFNPDVDGNVYAVAVQSDGKIIIGGSFTSVGGTTRARVARLNSNGSLDTSFGNPYIYGTSVDAVAVQSDGKVIAGGTFTAVGAAFLTQTYLARLNSDGNRDTAFNNKVGGGCCAVNHYVKTVVVQPDGKIIIGGRFTSVGGTSRNRVARLDSDGTVDSSFNPNVNDVVNAMVVQSDGKIIIGGNFTLVGGTTRNRVARLNSNGSLDTSIDPNVDKEVRAMVVQSDGKIVIGGGFGGTYWVKRLNS